MHTLNWFEIPVADIERATTFYAALLGKPLTVGAFQGAPMTLLDGDGCLMQDGRKASQDGARIYLAVDGQLDAVLARLATAGGALLQEPTGLGGGRGTFALFTDTEGNAIGLFDKKR